MMSSGQRGVSSRLPRMDKTFHLRSSNHEKHRSRTGIFESKSLCLLLFLLLWLTACHRSKQKVIAVVPKGQGHIFWQTVHAGANAAGEKFGVKVLWNGPASEIEISKQINILEDFINRRVDGIVVAPSDQKALVPVIESAVRKGIPVTIFDSGAETESYVSFVSTDNYLGGVKAAHRMAEILNKKGNVAIVGVMPGSASTTQRENGFKETLAKDYPQLKIVAFQYGMSDRARSLAVSEDILTANPNLDGIFGPNESSSIGAAQAVKGRSLTGKVKIVGFDSSPSLTVDLQEGVIDSLIVQNPFAMGFDGVKTICEKLDGKNPQRRIDTGVTVVTKSSLSDPKIQELIKPSLEKYLGSQ
jgi:ribose transport system substrate-binding protein